MKNKILLLSFILMSFSASAQYFEVGMEWVYVNTPFFTPGYPPTIETMKIVGDTVIDNEPVFIIEGNSTESIFDIHFISESGQQVFYYKDGEKRLLYDFSLENGDSWSVKSPWCCGDVGYGDTLNVIVDSVGSIIFNGTSLKLQYVHNDWSDWWQHVEGIGSLYGFFPVPGLAELNVQLRCVIYPNGDILKFTDAEDCYTIVGVNDIQQSGLAIYPNPVIDHLSIENKDEKAYELRVFNQQGQLLHFSKKAHTGQQLSTINWPSGSYLVQLAMDEGVFTQVIIKE